MSNCRQPASVLARDAGVLGDGRSEGLDVRRQDQELDDQRLHGRVHQLWIRRGSQVDKDGM
jgi:hypothetical protein